MKYKLAIIGAGGFGKEVKESILKNDLFLEKNIDFFVEDKYVDKEIPLSKLDNNIYQVLIAIANPIIRSKIAKNLSKNTSFYTFIDKSAQLISKNINIGEGAIICQNVILTTNIVIGKHCHLNLATTIGHDCIIGDYFTTAPGSKISGNVKIGESVYLGTNSSIKEKITICDNVIVGLNSGVVKNITEPGTYAGVPAKQIK